MCAFMTPVLKSDWAVHQTGDQGLRSPNRSPLCSPHSSSGDMPTEQRRQQVMRLREVQRLRKQLLAGRTSSGGPALSSRTSCPAMSSGRSSSYLSSGHASRVSLPVSSLALERKATHGKSRKLQSSNSLNNLSSKVLSKLKSVLNIKEKESSKDEDEDVEGKDTDRSPTRRRQGSNSPIESRAIHKYVRHHRGSRCNSSRSSFDAIPVIAEEKEL